MASLLYDLNKPVLYILINYPIRGNPCQTATPIARSDLGLAANWFVMVHSIIRWRVANPKLRGSMMDANLMAGGRSAIVGLHIGQGRHRCHLRFMAQSFCTSTTARWRTGAEWSTSSGGIKGPRGKSRVRLEGREMGAGDSAMVDLEGGTDGCLGFPGSQG